MIVERLKVLASTVVCLDFWRLGVRQWIGLAKASFSTRPATAPSGTIVYANCPPIGTLGFCRYLRGLKRLAAGQNVPLVAHVSLTDRCVYNCQRCSNLRRSNGDPTRTNVLGLLAELKQAGTASIAFTGGEPLLRDDLEAIVEACLPEMPPMLFTTGAGLDDQRARRLRAAGLVAAFISLDHHVPGEHDAIRGQQGAFAAAVRAISSCVSAGIYTAAQAVVTPSLCADGVLDRFLAFCRGLEVHDVVLLEPVPVCGRGCDGPLDDATRQRLAGLHRRAVRDRSLPKVTAMSFLEGADFFGCQAGTTFLYVSAAGEMFPCDFAPMSFGNVYELGLLAVLPRLTAAFPAPSTRCVALEMKRHCGESLTTMQRSETGSLGDMIPNRELLPGLMRWFLPSRGRQR